ncbi:MAG: hypothetical protein ACRDL6_12375 [Solirubrobacterales bacterium]
MVALVTGTVAAMVVTQSSRSDGPVASNIRMKTKPGRYRVCFFLTRDDTVGVDLVDADGDVIRNFATAARLDGGEPHCYDWDGLEGAGVAVAPGRYRLRLTLDDADRVATSGERLRVEEPR